MLDIVSSLLRLGLAVGLLYFVWALVVMLTDKDSPLRLPLCLSCGCELSRGDVVHCFECLSPELVGVENVRAVADCSVCGLPFVLSDSHDCEGSYV
jgi:hypothetical protein